MKKFALLTLVLVCLAMPVNAQPCYNTGSGVTVSVGVGVPTVPNVYYQPGYSVNNGYYYQNSGYYSTNGNCAPQPYYNSGYYPYPNGYYPNTGYYPAGQNPGPGYRYTNGCNQPVYYPSTGYNNRYINGRARPGIRVNVGFPVR